MFLKTFRIIAFLEGLSYLLLLFIAVPIKYFFENDMYVKLLGMPHGVLFIGYIIVAFLIKDDLKWNFRDFFIVLAASIIPFGTFYIDKKYLKLAKIQEIRDLK
jgi:integral membrane protein